MRWAGVVLSALALSCDPVADRDLVVKPTVRSLKPSVVGSRRGDEVTAFGSNFSEDMEIYVGGTAASGVVVRDEGELSFIAPPGRPGKVMVTFQSQSRLATIAELTYVADEVRFFSGTLGAELDTLGQEITAAADFDGDGLDDLLLTDTFTREQRRFQNFDGHFSLTGYPFPREGTLGAADLDGDSDTDLVGALVHLNERGSFTAVPGPARIEGSPEPAPPSSVLFTDLDGDKLPEAVEFVTTAPTPCATLKWWRFCPSPEAGAVEVCANGPDGLPTGGGAVGDVDGDGRGDFVFIGSSGYLRVRYGPGLIDESTSLLPVVPTGRSAIDLAVVTFPARPRPGVVVAVDDPAHSLLDVEQTAPRVFQGPTPNWIDCGAGATRLTTPLAPSRLLEQPLLTVQCERGAVFSVRDDFSFHRAAFTSAAPSVLANIDGDGRADLVWLGPKGIELAFGSTNNLLRVASFSPDPLVQLPGRSRATDELVHVEEPGDGVLLATSGGIHHLRRSGRSFERTASYSLAENDDRTIVGAGECGGFRSTRTVIVLASRDPGSHTVSFQMLSRSDTLLEPIGEETVATLPFPVTQTRFVVSYGPHGPLDLVSGDDSANAHCSLLALSHDDMQVFDMEDGWKRREEKLGMASNSAELTVTTLGLNHLIDVLSAEVVGEVLDLKLSETFLRTMSASPRRITSIPVPGVGNGSALCAIAPRLNGGYDLFGRAVDGYDAWVVTSDAALRHLELNAGFDVIAVEVVSLANSLRGGLTNPIEQIELSLGDFDGDKLFDVYPYVRGQSTTEGGAPLFLSRRATSMVRVAVPPRTSRTWALDIDYDGLDDFLYLAPQGGLAMFHNESR